VADGVEIAGRSMGRLRLEKPHRLGAARGLEGQASDVRARWSRNGPCLDI
jgi:hypothetical protein